MSRRYRIAVAEYSSVNAAEQARADLIGAGVAADDIILEPAGTAGEAFCLRIALPGEMERGLLDMLLSGETTRLYVHDAD